MVAVLSPADHPKEQVDLCGGDVRCWWVSHRDLNRHQARAQAMDLPSTGRTAEGKKGRPWWQRERRCMVGEYSGVAHFSQARALLTGIWRQIRASWGSSSPVLSALAPASQLQLVWFAPLLPHIASNLAAPL